MLIDTVSPEELNLGIRKRIAKKYRLGGELLDELVQEVWVKLMKNDAKQLKAAKNWGYISYVCRSVVADSMQKKNSLKRGGKTPIFSIELFPGDTMYKAKGVDIGETERTEVLRLDAKSKWGPRHEWLWDGDVLEACASGPGDGGARRQKDRKEQGEVERILKGGVRDGQNTDNLDVARVAHKYALESLEARPPHRDCKAGCKRFEICIGWQEALSVLRKLSRMGK